MRSSASGGAGREEERLVESTEEEEEQGRSLRRLVGWKKSPMDLEAAIGRCRCRRRSLATAATVGGKSVYVPNTNTMGQVITRNKVFYNYRIRNAGILSRICILGLIE